MSATLTRDAALTGFSREAVEALSHWKQEPDWVRDARLAAWDIYESLPMPKRTDEEWRRTDIRTLKLDVLKPFAEPNGSATTNLAALGGEDVANAKHFSIDLTRWGVSLEKEQAPKFIRKIAWSPRPWG